MNTKIMGLTLLIMGVLFLFKDKLPIIGTLPGDFSFSGKNWKVSFPLTSCLLLSLAISTLLSILFSLFGKK